MHFKSDNTTSVSAEILNALIEVNYNNQDPYGTDEYSVQLKAKFSEIFEKEVSIYFTSTGTAANCLALSSLIMPYESIACHNEAHIYTDECGASSLFTGGSSLILIDGSEGKINPNNLKNRLNFAKSLKPRMQKPGCITVTQATECGTIYSIDELKTIYDIAKSHEMPVHMDGARFANSLVALEVSPAELTWKAGVDVMSFGATKNGCLNAEAIVFFNQQYANNFEYKHKMAGQLMSKTRFFAAQFLAYFKNNLWIQNAQHANSMAQLVKQAFEKQNIKLQYSVQTNALFPILTKEIADHLRSQGCEFYSWRPDNNLYRFVTSCFSSIEEVTLLDKSLSLYFANVTC